MAKRGGLGKGLDALFLDNEAELGSSLMTLRLSEIEPNKDQPRKKFSPEELTELADSITEHGVLQPIVVRALPGGVYQIIAGERRWRASRQAGLSEIPALVIEADDRKVQELALIENLQRQDLDPIEEAAGYKSLMETAGLTQEEVAKRLGKSRPVVANALRLLGLPEEVQAALRAGKLSAGHARMLAGMESPEEQKSLAMDAMREGLSVRELEKRLRRMREEKNASPKSERPRVSREKPFGDTLAAELALSLAETTGRRVKIERNGEGGTLTVEFYNEKDLRELAEKLSRVK